MSACVITNILHFWHSKNLRKLYRNILASLYSSYQVLNVSIYGGEVPICCVLVPSTAVKTQVTSQEEILKMVKGHKHFRAMHSQESKYFTLLKPTIDCKMKGQGGKMLQVKGHG